MGFQPAPFMLNLSSEETRLKGQISSYDFATHEELKSSLDRMDYFMMGFEATALLLFYGDLQTAKVGWQKITEAWKPIQRARP